MSRKGFRRCVAWWNTYASSVDVNSTAGNPVQNAWTVQIVTVKSVKKAVNLNITA
jgi:hypothetical protein